MPEKLQISTAPYLVVNTSMVSCRCSTKCFFQHTSEISLAQLETSCLQAASHVFISPLPPGNKVLPETNLALSPSDDSRQLLQNLVSWCFVRVDVYRTPVTSGSSSSNILGGHPNSMAYGRSESNYHWWSLHGSLDGHCHGQQLNRLPTKPNHNGTALACPPGGCEMLVISWSIWPFRHIFGCHFFTRHVRWLFCGLICRPHAISFHPGQSLQKHKIWRRADLPKVLAHLVTCLPLAQRKSMSTKIFG